MPGKQARAIEPVLLAGTAGGGAAPVPASGFSGTEGYGGVRGDRDGVPSMCTGRDDPDWLLALAVYLYPDADTADGRRAIQLEASRELRRMAWGAQ